jgi:hypothetical protein
MSLTIKLFQPNQEVLLEANKIMGVTKIIVEGQLDEMLVKAILDKIGKTKTQVIEIVTAGDPTKDDPERLTRAINDLSDGIFAYSEERRTNKVAIIRDWDNYTKQNREDIIREALQNSEFKINTKGMQEKVAFETTLKSKKKPYIIKNVEFSYFCVGVKSGAQGYPRGETDNLLRKIAKLDAPIADCGFDCLEECLSNKGINEDVRNKFLSKLWVYNYQRFDDPARNTKDYFFTIEGLSERFNDLFDLEHSSTELQSLITYISSVAQ